MMQHDHNEQDKVDVEQWKSPGGYLWLQDKGYYDDPPNPVLLAELADGHYDEDLGREEAKKLAANLRKRLKDHPGLLEVSGDSKDLGRPSPI